MSNLYRRSYLFIGMALLVACLLSLSVSPTLRADDETLASGERGRLSEESLDGEAPNDRISFVEGEILIKFAPEIESRRPDRQSDWTTDVALNQRLAAQKVERLEALFPQANAPKADEFVVTPEGEQVPKPDLTRWYRVVLEDQSEKDEPPDALAAAEALSGTEGIAWAEPNYFYEFDNTPDDPNFYPNQWHLHNDGQYYLNDADIDAPEAWDILTGSETTVIAVIDTGIDRDHPDLDDHIWINPGEMPGNNTDDDGNGYVDDSWGWNWVSDQSDPDDFEPNDPRDDNGHGTHVAGIAAAETNNGTGVAGVCWNCKVMSLKAFETNGTATTSDIVQAIDYAADKGADVINMSFGSYAHSLLLEDTLAEAYGQALLVAAAGNGIRGKGTDDPFYPAAISYVMGVGASDVECVERDPVTQACLLIAEVKAPFSNYGVNADVCAPGVSIYSTYPGSYASMAGTSMAAPVVSGLAGLMMGHFPTWSKESFRGQMINTTDAMYVGRGFPACGSGRVNAYSALTVIPVPALSLLADSIEYGDETGDEDGIPDAGETLTMTMLLQNYWGEATDVVGTLSTTDPYVSLLDTNGSWGDISAYATLRNVADPFAFSLDAAAPNNHQVEFTLDLSSNGGSYTRQTTFSFLVQRGIEIPHALFPAIITEDMTLHSDYLYLVKQNMLVAEGATLTIEPGTRLQYDPAKFIKIQGTLIASGTADLPIYFTSNQKDPQPGDFQGIIFDDLAVDATLVPTPTVTLLAAEGSAIPDIGTIVSLTNPPQFSVAGGLHFSAIIAGTPDYEGIFRYVDGVGVLPAIVAGDAAPEGGQFTSFDEFYVSDYGDLYFIGQISGGTSGVFKLSFDGLTTIAQTGDAVPGVDGGTFTGFQHLAVNEYENYYENNSWMAFAGTYDDGAGGSGIGLYVQRVDLDDLLSVSFDSITGFMGTVQDVHAIWIGIGYDGPQATVSGANGVALLSSSYDREYQQYTAYQRWGSNSGVSTPLGGTFDAGTDDQQYYLNSTRYTVMGISGGSVSRALFKCDSLYNCSQTSQIILKDSEPLPGGGILDLSGPFDLAWDGSNLLFGAVVSGTNTTRLVRILDDGSLENVFAEGFPLPDGTTISSLGSLPNGVFANAFGEFALLVDTVSGQRVMFTQPSDEYMSGSILNHVIVEYGGGLLIDDSFPYIINSTFRYNEGAVPAGSSNPYGAIMVDRQEQTDSRALIIHGSNISDNPSHGLYVRGSGLGRFIFSENTVWNNTLDWGGVVSEYLEGAGLYLTENSLAAKVSGNSVQHNRALNCAGMYIAYRTVEKLRFEGNDLRKNEAFYPEESRGGGGGCLQSSSGLLRRNTIANNIEQTGYELGNAAARAGGSAFQVRQSSPIMQFNTIVGNEAKPGNSPRTAPGHTLLFYQQPTSPLTQLTHNNILDNQASFDLYLSNSGNQRQNMNATQNFWGTTDAIEIRYDRIYDYWQDFSPGEAFFEPFLTAPEPGAPGFLWQATIEGGEVGLVNAELMTVTLDFSREMNTVISPTVTFGVDEPYTQNPIENGAWISPTRWVGTYQVAIWTGDGINTLRVTDAEDTSGMEIPEDTRFEFVIQTAGTSSGVLLEGSGHLGYTHLNWNPSTIDNLAGYVIYRSPVTNTDYAAIATVLTTNYTDTNVVNSNLYYYKYAILNTDFEEVAESNEIALVPDDLTLPETPTVTDDGASTHYFDWLHATWSSQDQETGITEYQYCIGTAAESCDTISWTSAGTQSEVTRSGLNLVDGQSYYFSVKARNGAGHWSVVGSSDGITIDKLPPPLISAVAPSSGERTTSHQLTLSGSGFQASPAPIVKLGSTTLGNVNVVGPTQLTAEVPAGIAAGVYEARITNFDTQIGTLTDAYTATNPIVSPRPFIFSPAIRQVSEDEGTTTVDVYIQDVTDLSAFEFDVVYDPSVVHLEDVTLSSFLGSGGRDTTPLGPEIDNINGRVTFAAFSFGSGNGANGSGTLATITFSPQSEGTSDLTFENIQMFDSLNIPIPADLQTGEIQVVQYPFGDFDRDCDVDIVDIMVVASRWNTQNGDPDYDPTYDLDNDGDIDIADIMPVATAWGNTCTVDGLQMTRAKATSQLAESGATFRLLTSQSSIQLDEEVEITVEIEKADNLGGVEVDLLFDPALFELQELSLGPALESTGNTALALPPLVDAETGRMTWGAFSFGEHEGAANGQLLTISLIAKQEGRARFDLSHIQLVDLEGQVSSPAEVVPAQVTIGSIPLYLPLIVNPSR